MDDLLERISKEAAVPPALHLDICPEAAEENDMSVECCCWKQSVRFHVSVTPALDGDEWSA
jgi:hypothetical protein